MHIGAPDYNSLKDRVYMQQQNDPRYPQYITFMNYVLLKELIEKSTFCTYKFYDYWKDGSFYQEPIDYLKSYFLRIPSI